MRIRHGFVSNSSSTAFIITNKTAEGLTLVDFVKENPQLIEEYVERYSWSSEDEYNQEKLLASAEKHNKGIAPGRNLKVFGDEDGTLIGQVFDYILRDGGESERFSWKFEEYYR